MLAPAVPGRLARIRLVVAIIVAPPPEPRMSGTNDDGMLVTGGALYWRGGGGPCGTPGPCACVIKCCRCRTGTTPGT